MAASDDVQRDPALTLTAPGTLRPWERAEARIEVLNMTDQPILPVSLELSSERGVIERWGIEGRIVRWGYRTWGRRTDAGWEVFTGPPTPEQQPRAGSGPPLGSTGFVGAQPLWPGERSEVHAYFDAEYQHGDHLSARLEYIALDPREREICAPIDEPRRDGLATCRRIDRMDPDRDVALYLRTDELDRGSEVVVAKTVLKIVHPAFDIDQARGRAGVSEGPFGYETRTGRWILVDPSRGRTLLVGGAGATPDLPGDWLELMLALNSAPATTITWMATSPAEAQEVRSLLEGAGIEGAPFAYKGGPSAPHLLVTVDRASAERLAQVVEHAGARVEDLRVVK